MATKKETPSEKSGSGYVLTGLAASYIVLPLLLSLLWRCINIAGGGIESVQANSFGLDFGALSQTDIAGLAAVFLASGVFGVLAGKKLVLPADGYLRYAPLLVPFFLTCLAAIVYFEGAGTLAESGAVLALKLFNAPAFAAWSAPEFANPLSRPILLYTAGFIPFLLALHCGARQQPLESLRPLSMLGLVTVLVGSITCSLWVNMQERLLPEGMARMAPLKLVQDSTELAPFTENNRLSRPGSAPALAFGGNYPRIGGSEDAYPLYAAAAQTLFKDVDAVKAQEYIHCGREWEAYLELFSGGVDVIFVKEPVEAVFDEARRRGVELVVVPIAREALVFFTHQDTPVASLDGKQVQDIYSKIILNWKRLGGPDMPIIPFQQPEYGTAHGIFLGDVMVARDGIVVTMKPLEETLKGKRVTAAYRNLPGAIGYGLRWEVEELNADAGLKTLAIEGVSPSLENIRDNSYPFTLSLCAVLVEPPSPEAEQLLDWLISPEGKEFIEKAGYVPLEGKQIRSRPKKVFDNQRGFI